VEGRSIRCFPQAGTLARARFNKMGITGARIASIQALARAVHAGELTLEPHADPTETYNALLALPGIGPWTAEYVVMRALKHPDAFPSSDLGLLRAFDGVYGRRIKPNELEALAENWRPWRSYAALTLWQHTSGG
jgi:AraC family transcriptional regulator of adaptative response / DNA-3-methyladenine glycosylase II